MTAGGIVGADFKFSMYTPSTVAAACVRLAVSGLLGDSWCSQHRLDRRLLRITHTDQVNSKSSQSLSLSHASFFGFDLEVDDLGLLLLPH